MDEPSETTAQGEIIMKYDKFTVLLIASRPEERKVSGNFTDSVMNAVNSTEILSGQIRRMNVNKKETFIMKLRHLPRFAILAIAIGSLVILSGATYATYKLLWPKPQVNVSKPTTSYSGRDEVIASLKQCGDDKLTSRYELKKNATIAADQISSVVKAHCELDTIGTWATSTFPNNDNSVPADSHAHDTIRANESMATQIKSMTSSSITFAGLTKYNLSDTTLVVTASTRFIDNGRDVPASQIKAGDSVVYITSDVSHFTPSSDCTAQHCSMSGTQVSQTLQAVVKLSLPLESYDQLAWQSLTEIVACEGNPNDDCLSGTGAIDLYQDFENTDPAAQMKEIQGFVTSIDGTSFTIKSSSGSLFTITTPTDVISVYNKKSASQYYNNQTVKIGSGLDIRYMENPDLHSKSISGKGLMTVQLEIEVISKAYPVQAY
jgi:hypothetical protein